MSVLKKIIYKDKSGTETSLEVGADSKNIDTSFTEASTRANIASGEKLSVILGKIKKWFADLHDVAFSGSYTDLSNKPTSLKNPNSLTIKQNSDSGTSYDGSEAKSVDITPSGIGAAPKSHATSATTYGKGDASSYGHLRLSDDTSSTSGTSGGIAATPNSVKKAYDLAAAKARTATLVVAASNSSAKSKAAADYVCDGTSDQAEINNAISALPSTGGKVLLLEGTYNISAYINASKSNVTIEGVGNGTVLKRMFNDGSAWNEQGIIYIQGSSIKNCTVKNMRFDGNRSSYTGTNNAAVKVSYSASNITITGLTIENEGNGIIISGAVTSCKIAYNTILESNQHGIEIGNVSNTMVCGNYIIDSAVNGILVEWGSSYNKIFDNFIMCKTGESASYTSSQFTIKIDNGQNNIVTDNYIPGKNYVNNGGSTNTFVNNIWEADNNVVAGVRGFVAGGTNNTAHSYSFVAGGWNNALSHQAKFGHLATDGSAGQEVGTTGDALIIGNGAGNNKSNAFRVSYAGAVYGKSSFNSSGADYAEFFEWLDGNPDGVDRIGLFVTLDGDKIRIANVDDDYILGAISGAPGVIGNNHADTWQGMWTTDIFGRVLTHTVHHEAEYEDREIKTPRVVTDEEADKPTIEYDVTTERVLVHEAYDAIEPIVNPDYNPDEKYIPREERPEWSIVGMMGQLVIIDDGTCEVNGCCKVADGGTATASESGWRVIARLDETHIKVLFR